MGTAYERATEFLHTVESAAEGQAIMLPQTRYTMFGTQMVQCEGVIVSVDSIGPYVDLTGRIGLERCGPPQVATIRTTIARDWVCQNEDGTDDPIAIGIASAAMQADADLLWDCVWEQEAYLGPSQVNIESQITGGLVVVSVVFTIGIQ